MTWRAALQPLRPAWRASRRLLLRFRRPPVMILLYHRVCTLESDPQQLAVCPERFRAQMRILQQAYPILRLEEDWSTVRRPAVIVTFDDGYADLLGEALPILEELGIPATFFVSTGNVATGEEFWWDRLERLLLTAAPSAARFQLRDARGSGDWPAATPGEREKLLAELHARMKKVEAGTREEWFRQLREWARVDDSPRASHRPLTVDELRRLAASPWACIGAHGVTHTPLSSLSPELQRQEILRSRQQLESWLGREVKSFSFPFGGRADFDRDSVRLCFEAGFARVLANVPGGVRDENTRRPLPRWLVRDWPADRFEQELSGFLRS